MKLSFGNLLGVTGISALDNYDTSNDALAFCSQAQFVKMLKLVFTNKARFESRFLGRLRIGAELAMAKGKEGDAKSVTDFCQKMAKLYDKHDAFTLKEAFSLSNKEFQAVVFKFISVPDMMAELGHERIKTEGITLNLETYDKEGNFTGMEENNNVYELYKVDRTKLGLDTSGYAIKCWCTTTNKEHWLWIQEKYANSPLEGIASTFVVHENIIPFITAIRRQGDVLMVDMSERVEPMGNKRSLTADEYFKLLKCQS